MPERDAGSGIRFVLFDYGNTLVPYGRDEARLVDACVAAVAAEHIPGLDAGTFVAIVRSVKDDLMRRTRETGREIVSAELAGALAQAAGVPSSGEAFLAALEQATSDAFERTLRLPVDTIAVLDSLRPRYRLGLVSNYFLASPLRRTLHRFGIAERMDAVVVSGEVGVVKPRREIFDVVLRQLGARADECVFVGDNLHADIGGASALGMATVHTRQWLAGALGVDSEHVEGSPRPDAVVNHLSELPALLSSRWER